MRSLSAHLREPGDHGHLPFHPSCPRCCAERLGGALPSDELVGQRSRALLAAAVLAGSTLAPTAAGLTSQAVAAQEDSDDENAPTDGDEPSHRDLDGDGGLEDSDTPPLEPESTPVAPVPPTPPAPTPTPPTPAPTPPTPSTPVPPATPTPPATQPPVTGLAPPPSETVDSRPAPRPKRTEPKRLGAKRDRLRDQQRSARADERPQPTTSRGSVQPAPASPSPDTAAGPRALPETDQTQPAQAGQRRGPTHVVRPGECLWSIAQNHLGANATPAAVARLVNRLWELNAERIATGERDLVMVGTPLRMP